MRAEYVAYRSIALVFETQEELEMMLDMMGYDTSIPAVMCHLDQQPIKKFMEKVRLALTAPK